MDTVNFICVSIKPLESNADRERTKAKKKERGNTERYTKHKKFT